VGTGLSMRGVAAAVDQTGPEGDQVWANGPVMRAWVVVREAYMAPGVDAF
jgi:hypothetical protein